MVMDFVLSSQMQLIKGEITTENKDEEKNRAEREKESKTCSTYIG